MLPMHAHAKILVDFNSACQVARFKLQSICMLMLNSESLNSDWCIHRLDPQSMSRTCLRSQSPRSCSYVCSCSIMIAKAILSVSGRAAPVPMHVYAINPSRFHKRTSGRPTPKRSTIRMLMLNPHPRLLYPQSMLRMCLTGRNAQAAAQEASAVAHTVAAQAIAGAEAAVAPLRTDLAALVARGLETSKGDASAAAQLNSRLAVRDLEILWFF